MGNLLKIIPTLVGSGLGLALGGALGLLAGVVAIPHSSGPGEGLGVLFAGGLAALLGTALGGIGGVIANHSVLEASPALPNTPSDDETWPPPVLGQVSSVQSHNAFNRTATRGLVTGGLSILFTGLALITRWIPMWVVFDCACAVLPVGLAFSVGDILYGHKSDSLKSIISGAVGVVCNLMPCVILAIVGFLD